MPNLLTVPELRALVPSGLTDTQLTTLIGWVEDEITDAIGAPYTDDTTYLTEVVSGGGQNLFLKRKIKSVSTLTEFANFSDTTGVALTSTEYQVWPDQGRIQRTGGAFGNLAPADVFYLSDAAFENGGFDGSGWGARVTVVYVPKDENSQRKRATADLVRLMLSQTAYSSESVGGEISYQAPSNWEEEKRRIMRRISFLGVA